MKYVLIIVGVILAAAIGFVSYTIATTKSHSPEQVVKAGTSNLEVSVFYNRPFKKGRKIFGELVPYNEYWRTGANEATEITFSVPVNFGGKKIDAGTYRLYTIPGKKTWDVVLNSEQDEWGYLEPDYEKDVLKITVPSSQTMEETEQFTITLPVTGQKIELVLRWDTTQVTVPILPA